MTAVHRRASMWLCFGLAVVVGIGIGTAISTPVSAGNSQQGGLPALAERVADLEDCCDLLGLAVLALEDRVAELEDNDGGSGGSGGPIGGGGGGT